MTPNKRDLKAYVRFDGSGRVVPGSLVLRRSKPKNGNWKETQAYECCDTFECIVPPVLLSVSVDSGFPINTGADCYPILSMLCNELPVFFIDIRLWDAIPDDCTLEQYIEQLNTYFSWIGTWSLIETTITLEMNGSVASALCSTGELTMLVTVACPA